MLLSLYYIYVLYVCFKCGCIHVCCLLVMVQVVNVMSTPIEISLITLFLRLGELVMSVPNEQKMHIRVRIVCTHHRNRNRMEEKIT